MIKKLLRNKKAAIDFEGSLFTTALVTAIVAFLGILFRGTILKFTGHPIGFWVQVFVFLFVNVFVGVIIIKGSATSTVALKDKIWGILISFALVVLFNYGLFAYFPKIIPGAFDAQSIYNMNTWVAQNIWGSP